MEEEDEDNFYKLLEICRQTLKQYGQTKLLEYFEEFYFKETRIKQWAKWYRLKMYGCKWILHTNMHVESWHNILKTRIMGRLTNVRVDKLMRILLRAEVI